MPHVIVKMYPGRSENEKKLLSEAIAKSVEDIAGSSRKSISVAVEEIGPDKWVEEVYKPDIMEKEEELYIKPGYNPFE